MEITASVFKKILEMFALTAGLVLKQNNGDIGDAACPAKPHIAFELRQSTRLVKYLQGSLVSMQNLVDQKSLF